LCLGDFVVIVFEMTAVAIKDVKELEEQYQLATYKKMPIVAERGEGVWVFTSDGERYLDLYGGHAVAGTGHCHPHVVAAIKKQADELLFYSNLVYSEARAKAAQKLISIAPDTLTKAFFCNSGTEANENAMRMARDGNWPRERHHVQWLVFTVEPADAISATFSASIARLAEPNVPGHLQAEFGDIDSVRELADDSIAAICS
jgi:acetylornithine/succinyldiaminopimelate/putrescine aminotransferase